MKKMKIAALMFGALLLAGCGNQAVEKNENKNKQETQNQEREQERNQNGIISSIKDAMNSGKEMKCTYRIKAGQDEIETVSYVKGNKYRTETNMNGMVQKMIYVDDTMYSWSGKDKKGLKMTKACTDELAGDVSENSKEDVPEEMNFSAENNFKDAVDVKCEAVSGTDFEVPSDVQFEDQCEMMRNMTQSMKGLQNGAGMGAGMPKLTP